MAVTIDATNEFSFGAGGSGSHTCTGSDRYLLAFCFNESTAISDPTYNSVTMTQVGTWTNGTYRGKVYGLIAPATGANTFTRTDGGNPRSWLVSFTGVDQSTPVGTPVQANGSSVTPSVDVTGATDGMVIDYAVSQSPGGSDTITAGASQTDRYSGRYTTFEMHGISTETGTGTRTMSWTLSASAVWNSIGVLVNPVAAAGTSIPVLQAYYAQRRR